MHVADEVELLETHTCRALTPVQAAGTFAVRVMQTEEGWFLHQESFATPHDVRCGEADFVGEVMASNTLRIAFCPFCGKRLAE